MESKKLIGYFDGACHPNPGERGIGAVLFDRSGCRLAEISQAVGYGTNNEAEWLALIALLELLVENRERDVLVCGDATIVVNAISRDGKLKPVNSKRSKKRAQNLVPLFHRALELAHRIDDIEFKWIPRERNGEADKLSTAFLPTWEPPARTSRVAERLGDRPTEAEILAVKRMLRRKV